jgi:predicted ATPase
MSGVFKVITYNNGLATEREIMETYEKQRKNDLSVLYIGLNDYASAGENNNKLDDKSKEKIQEIIEENINRVTVTYHNISYSYSIFEIIYNELDNIGAGTYIYLHNPDIELDPISIIYLIKALNELYKNGVNIVLSTNNYFTVLLIDKYIDNPKYFDYLYNNKTNNLDINKIDNFNKIYLNRVIYEEKE